MQITVKLFATFRTGRTPLETRNYPVGTTMADLIAEREIPVAEIGIMLVNCRHVQLDRVLADGDLVAIFPLLGGG